MQAKQPLINRKLAIRTVACLFALAILIAGYQWLKGRGADIDFGTANTVDWVAALKYGADGGSRAVVIKPDGDVVESGGYASGANDQDLAWRPDGNRIFFSSNRDQQAYNIYRWNLATGAVDRRTLGKIAKTDPSFPWGLPDADNRNPLMVYSGMAWDLDPAKGTATQLVPVRTDSKDASVDVERDESSGSAQLGSYGEGATFKIRQAAYIGSNADYVAVVRRTDDGELLQIQKLNDPSPPKNVIAGDRIFIDVGRDGKLFYAVLGFQWPSVKDIPPEMIHNGVASKPWRHVMGFLDVSDPAPSPPITASNSDRFCFSQPSVSPDGTRLLMTTGVYNGSGDYATRALYVLPAVSNATNSAVRIYPLGKLPAETPIGHPNWSADGKRVVFQTKLNGVSEICEIDSDGGNFKELTKGKGSFGAPIFSPQAPAGAQ